MCDYFTGLCLKLALPLDHLCLLSKPCSLGLHGLDETKAESDTVVFLEWCSKPEMRLLCFVVASVSGGCGDGGKQIWEEQTKGGKHRRLIRWCSPGRGSGRKGFADAAFLCSYLHLWQQPQPDSLSGSWPKALMTAGGRRSVPGSQGPFVSEGYRLSLRRHIITQLRAG